MGSSTGLSDVGGQRLGTPPIRGRAGELKVIGALVAAVAKGRGGVLVIEGPPGIGKSRLLTEVLALADKSGVRTLFGEAFEYQQTVPFFSLFMATLRADPPVGDAEALRRLGGSADLRYWVVHDLADAIHAAAAQTPLVILLEDIHWADSGTLLALRSLATVRADVAVLWVLTARTGAGGPAVQETLSVLQRANATVVRVGAMAADAVADMVCDAVRARADESLLNLAAKAHGNPFLVSELVGGLGEEGRLDVSGGCAMVTGHALPLRLGASMQQRLDLLSAGASEVVRVAAVLPDRFSAGLLAAMLDRPPTSLLSTVGEAVRADLLVEDGERLRFRHDLLREATRQSFVLGVVGRLDDAAARVADGTERARREGNAMALDLWAVFGGIVHLAAGRLSAARAAVESLPPPESTGATEPDMVRTMILAEVAAHTDDRNLLQQMVNDARDACPTGSFTVGRGAAHVLALAAWQRDDVHDAMRWLGGDITLFGTPLFAQVLDLVILGARVASAAGDAGLRARVLQATELLERERPRIPLFIGVGWYARGILERDAAALVAAAGLLESSSRPLLYAAAAEDAGGELARTDRRDEAVDQLNAAFDTYMRHEALTDARRVGRQLRRLGVERRIVSQPRAKAGWDSLTDAELKVVSLIAQGVTNRDVATRLHLSLHTVKTHIRNAFAKMGINSRAQLAQLMRGTD